MPNAIDILEPALLLLVAFLVGAIAGAGARLIAARLFPPAPVFSPIRVPRVVPPDPQSLAPPPLVESHAQSAPENVPGPDFKATFAEVLTPSAEPQTFDAPELVVVNGAVEAGGRPPVEQDVVPLPPAGGPVEIADATVAEVAPQLGPAHAAGETMSGRRMVSPAGVQDMGKLVDIQPGMPSAEVLPFPRRFDQSPSEPQVVSGEGRPEAPEFGCSAESEPETLETAVDAEMAKPILCTNGSADAAVAASAAAVAAARAVAAAVLETAREAARPEEEEAVAPAPVDEQAMTGGEAAAGTVVDAAREPVSSAASPPLLHAPDGGRADDLTNIVGVLPLLETALNEIGVFHLAQIAAWTDGEVAWVEKRLGIAGRIMREHWREQAKGLVEAGIGALPGSARA